MRKSSKGSHLAGLQSWQLRFFFPPILVCVDHNGSSQASFSKIYLFTLLINIFIKSKNEIIKTYYYCILIKNHPKGTIKITIISNLKTSKIFLP